MKKILALCLVAVLAATAVIGGTLAYFTDNDDQATNTFTVGNVEIELTEPNWDSTGVEDAPEVYPGEPLAKDPTVENVGANPCFVRVQVTGLDCLIEEGVSEEEIGLRYLYQSGYNTADWTYLDGWYYYNGVLAEGEKTTPVFDQIVIPSDLHNDVTEDGAEIAEDASFDVVVTAQAVQAQGAKPSFSAVEAMTAEEIAAWFVTCGL